MKPVVIAIGSVLLAVLLFVGGAYTGSIITKSRQIAADNKALKDEQGKVEQVSKENTDLSAKAATLKDTVTSLNQRIATQPTKERIVYVKVKPTAANPTPAPTAITSAVFVTVGAVSLFNDAFYGVPQGASSASGDTAGGSISTTSLSDYERTTNSNGSACYENQQTVILLWRYIYGLQAVGFIEKN